MGADTIARRRQTRGWTPVARLDLVRDQGGVGYSARHRMFVVVHGDEVLALSAISPHSPTAPEPVLFCPSSGYFEATQHGEKFDRRGVYVVGSAPRGLDRFPVMTYGGLVYSKPGRLQPGPPRGTEALPREGPFCSTPDTARSGFFRPAG